MSCLIERLVQNENGIIRQIVIPVMITRQSFELFKSLGFFHSPIYKPIQI